MARNTPIANPRNPGASAKNVLVIKLSALGDFVLALGAMKAVREFHLSARITLLTTPIYQATSTVRIQPWGNFIVEGQDVATTIGSSNEIDLFMETQGTVIESRNLAEVVASSLSVGTRNALLGPTVDENRPPQRSDAEWEDDKRRMAVTQLQAGVSADVPMNSQVIAITSNRKTPRSRQRSSTPMPKRSSSPTRAAMSKATPMRANI